VRGLKNGYGDVILVDGGLVNNFQDYLKFLLHYRYDIAKLPNFFIHGGAYANAMLDTSTKPNSELFDGKW
jgi:hypothetical protein